MNIFEWSFNASNAELIEGTGESMPAFSTFSRDPAHSHRGRYQCWKEFRHKCCQWQNEAEQTDGRSSELSGRKKCCWKCLWCIWQSTINAARVLKMRLKHMLREPGKNAKTSRIDSRRVNVNRKIDW